ncbi:MAG: GTP-binding protein, partial [Candidatus Hydrogenedentes bacterium]|nr:GTP-binding protein [Candidatus Hydrogenedentota bacterium]
GRLTALKGLALGQNQLSTLPPEIGRLTALTWLKLWNNQLSTLPPEIRQLTGLRQLYLHHNDRLGIPLEILGPTSGQVYGGKGKPAAPSAILGYYFRTQVEASRALNEVKVLLVGEAQVGKTSLVKAVVHNKACVPGEKMTEGISIDRWAVGGKRAGETVRLNIWDFGGQEIMHATHQFFLTKRSLYLLVLDARQDEKQCRLEYWLRLVQSCGGDSPVIVVVNKIDDGRLKLDRNGLIIKYAPNLKGFVETSCESLEGVPKLRERIAREVNSLEHVDNRLPVSYFAVKEVVEAKARRTPHMRWDQYTAVCARSAVTGDEEQEHLARFLHDLGVVLCFRDDDRLAGLGVLSPRWVTSGVYAIITSDRLNRAGGVLCRDCLEQILRRGKYAPEKRNFIIEMMKKFELCFAFDEGGDERWLIPGLLDKERPAIEWDDAGAVGFEYRYAVLPGSVIWRFIVRNHELLGKEKPVYWRSGVVLHIDGAEALMVADEEGKRLSISVRGPSAVLRRSALTHIRMELEHIHSNLPRIDAKGRVPLPDRPDVTVDYQHLLNLEGNGILKFWPEGADREYMVADLLEGVSGKGQRARERQRRQEGKDWGRGERNEIFISYSHKDKGVLDELKVTLDPLIDDDKLNIWEDTQLKPGAKWQDEIRDALARAKVGVLLVSRAFLASRFIKEVELPALLDAAESEGLTLFWIPVEHSLYEETAIKDYQAAWDPKQPLDTLGKGLAKALVEIGKQLKKAYETP